MNTVFQENDLSWEEFASSFPRKATDTERIMAAVIYRRQYEGQEHTAVSPVVNDYFRRARWPRPTNISATANHCASKGWLSEVELQKGRKRWRVTRKGYDALSVRLQQQAE